MGCLTAVAGILVRGAAMVSLVLVISGVVLIGSFFCLEVWRRGPWHG